MAGAGIEPANFRCTVGSDCGTSPFILLRPRASWASKRRWASGCRCWRHGQAWQPNRVTANQLPMSPPPRPDAKLLGPQPYLGSGVDTDSPPGPKGSSPYRW